MGNPAYLAWSWPNAVTCCAVKSTKYLVKCLHKHLCPSGIRLCVYLNKHFSHNPIRRYQPAAVEELMR